MTGGGITGNLPRILPAGLAARIDAQAWTWPPVFRWLQEAGGVATEEMYRTFNCGIGLVVVVEAADAEAAERLLTQQGETVFRLGRVEAAPAHAPRVVIA